MPRRSYTCAIVLSTIRLVGVSSHSGKATVMVSSALFHCNPNSMVSSFPAPSCCFAKLWSDSSDGLISDSSSGTFECHLCNLKSAFRKMSVAVSFKCVTFSTLVPSVIRSSTYKSRLIFSTYSGCSSLKFSIFFAIVPPSRNGEGPNPKSALVNFNV